MPQQRGYTGLSEYEAGGLTGCAAFKAVGILNHANCNAWNDYQGATQCPTTVLPVLLLPIAAVVAQSTRRSGAPSTSLAAASACMDYGVPGLSNGAYVTPQR